MYGSTKRGKSYFWAQFSYCTVLPPRDNSAEMRSITWIPKSSQQAVTTNNSLFVCSNQTMWFHIQNMNSCNILTLIQPCFLMKILPLSQNNPSEDVLLTWILETFWAILDRADRFCDYPTQQDRRRWASKSVSALLWPFHISELAALALSSWQSQNFHKQLWFHSNKLS